MNSDALILELVRLGITDPEELWARALEITSASDRLGYLSNLLDETTPVKGYVDKVDRYAEDVLRLTKVRPGDGDGVKIRVYSWWFAVSLRSRPPLGCPLLVAPSSGWRPSFLQAPLAEE